MSDYQRYPDSQLVSLTKLGDTDAYTEIYNRYFRLMFTFGFKKLRDEDLAKDYVQELFVGIWEKRSELNEETNFAAFLYVALRSKIFNYYAHQKVENKYADFLAFHVSIAAPEQSDHLIRDKQLNEYIEKQIQALPKKMRRIFELSRKEHLSHKEIALIVNTSEFTVSKQISNALRIIRSKTGRAITVLIVSIGLKDAGQITDFL
ncbi:RNA polymerase sigma-70 factor [Pedobacter ureilyticus]|uniref:RNA polymerase sigma-70 factor n=1 Tax=Pedobacter ureilyticus TaxID=1393051 RepID=UPI00110C7E74|nr:RNA polymerase sigma-70 factor [Pedobacter helvus]